LKQEWNPPGLISDRYDFHVLLMLSEEAMSVRNCKCNFELWMLRLSDGRESLKWSTSLACHTASSSQPGIVAYSSSASLILEEIKTSFLMKEVPKICWW
jgi:hypothetical protein